jgi:hypothetical protein
VGIPTWMVDVPNARNTLTELPLLTKTDACRFALLTCVGVLAVELVAATSCVLPFRCAASAIGFPLSRDGLRLPFGGPEDCMVADVPHRFFFCVEPLPEGHIESIRIANHEKSASVERFARF